MNIIGNIENIFKKIPLPYPMISMIFTGIICLIFIFFSIKVEQFSLNLINQLKLSALSFLIGFQLAGIQYSLNYIKKTLIQLKYISKDELTINDLGVNLEKRIRNSNYFYIVAGLMIGPFIIIDLAVSQQKLFYYDERTVWSFFLDIFNHLTGYLLIFLLAIILWIILNIALTISEVGRNLYKQHIKIDIFNVDKICELIRLRNLVLNVLIFYFICITLAIISYISLDRSFRYESFFLLVLLLIGVSFFFIGLGIIRKIIRSRIEKDLIKINEEYQRQHQRFMDIISKKNSEEKDEMLNSVASLLEVLYAERELILKLRNNVKRYDLITIAKFVGSFIPPLIAFSAEIIQLQ